MTLICASRSAMFEHVAVRAHGVVVSQPLGMREALGSIPTVSTCLWALLGNVPQPKNNHATWRTNSPGGVRTRDLWLIRPSL